MKGIKLGVVLRVPLSESISDDQTANKSQGLFAMQSLQYLPAVWAVLIGVCFMPLIMRFCVSAGWVDKPDTRKLHEGAIPLAGGLCVMLTVSITLFTFGAPHVGLALFLAALLVFTIGFIDDKYPLRARYRFGCHLLAATIVVVLEGTVVRQLGDTFGPVPVGLGILAIPFTILAIAGVINAFNMIDGLDGLAGGQGFISMAWLAIGSAAVPAVGLTHPPLSVLGPVLFSMMGAILAFLSFNMRTPWRRKASVFLGDGGSMLIGFLIAWAAIVLASDFGPAGIGPASVIWVIAVPLIDMFSCIIRRILDGQTPMSADRKHLHHLLMTKGLSAGSAVTVLNITAFVCGFIGIAGWLAEIPQYMLFWPLIVIFVVYLAYARRFWRSREESRLSQATVRAA